MQPNINLFEKIRKDFGESQNILVMVPPGENLDTLAAGLAIYLSLAKKGKNVSIVSPQLPRVEQANLVGIDKISSEASSGKFVITLSDVLGSVDKVTHYLEDDKLNIVIHPLPGSQPFSKEKVSFNASKPSFDQVILVGVEDLNDMGNLYTQDTNLYSKVPILSIGKELIGQRLNAETFSRRSYSSLSEIATILLSKLNLPIDEDIAQNLFQGIAFATDNFQSPSTSADAFEAAALCLKSGARKSVVAQESIRKQEPARQPISQPVQYQTGKPAKTPEESEELKEPPEPEEPELDWFTPPKIYKSSKSS